MSGFTGLPNKQSLSFFFLLVLVFISRLPLLFLGYGSDGDGWRVALSASTLWNEGVYQPSRFPGFPIYEMLNAPLVGLGSSLLSNSATMIVFIVAIVFFKKILERFEIPGQNILVWTFAFMPILWKNSAVTVDYVWGLTFIIVSLFFLLENKIILSAVMLGIAVGTRLTHIIFLIPYCILLYREGKLNKVFLMGGITLVISTLCFLPMLLRPELKNDIFVYLADIRHYSFIRMIGYSLYRSVFAIGLFGAISIIIFLFLSHWRVIELFKSNDKLLQICIAAIIIMLGAFFFMADEREYLIPIIPFVLMALGIILKRKYLIVTCICLLSYSFINLDLIEHGFGKQRFSPNIISGFVVNDYGVRRKSLQAREILPNYPLPDSCVVMTAVGPKYWFENPHLKHSNELTDKFNDDDASVSIEKPDQYFVFSLTSTKCQEVQHKGYHVYYLKDMREYLESFLFYNLDSSGAQPLDFQLY